MTGEECDGDALGGATCEGLGYGGGTLSCDEECLLDESLCEAAENQAPQLVAAETTAYNTDGTSGALFGPGEVLRIEARATDDVLVTSVVADLTAFGGGLLGGALL